MVGLLIALHIIVCLALILIILLQAGKGADLGSALGGGSSQTAFGARRGNILTRFTTICAILFMITSLALTFAYLPRLPIKKGLETKEEVPAKKTPEEPKEAKANENVEAKSNETK